MAEILNIFGNEEEEVIKDFISFLLILPMNNACSG